MRIAQLHLYGLLSHLALALWLIGAGLWWQDLWVVWTALPLLLPLWSMRQASTYASAWACFLHLYYIAAGISGLLAQGHLRLTLGESLLALSAFVFNLLYIRATKQAAAQHVG